ncbi:hypothetical protein K8I85_02070, partial [bacterium]|nr:hypothetical protein [bacterium]
MLNSTCQLYSGTGTALFDWMRLAREHLDFTVLIDAGVTRNFGIARRFCREQGIPLIPSAPQPLPGCPDYGVAATGTVLTARRWDYVECVSWANAATNLAVLENLPPDATLLFTPHTQPLDTLPDHERHHSVTPVFERMLAESAAIFIDSPGELEPYRDRVDPGDRVHRVDLGVDCGTFSYEEGDVHDRVVCLGDFAEARKRVDLVFGAFAACLEGSPSLTLEIAGHRSEELAVPRRIRARTNRHGYIDREDLVRLVRESKVLLQLSD